MKNLKNVFSILLVLILSISVIFFMTCEKEDIEPAPLNEVENANLNSHPDRQVTLTNPDLEPQSEFAIPIRVSIEKSKCGYTVTASSSEANLTDGGYTVKWYKKPDRGEPFFIGESLKCVCGFPARVDVTDDSGTLAASKLVDIPGC